MINPHRACEVLVIGAGPAGLAAAASAAESGNSVLVIDDNPGPGGQIWRGSQQHSPNVEATKWVEKVRRSGVQFIHGATAFDQPAPGLVFAETITGLDEIGYKTLVIATGARERFLPFPGWTLPNVCGAGGLQALAKTGFPVDGKRMVVAGTGPLLMAVAAYLRAQGAEILLIAEQAPWSRLTNFGLSLLKSPAKAVQAAGLRSRLAGVRYLAGCWVTSAEGVDKLESVNLRQGRNTWAVDCDYLACGFHLVPNVELAAFFGCELKDDGVRVDEFQQTSV
ncbi:MAG TPA: FAD/NAD(P)-binding oxidoreductase, partial [Blastocatellia bacterium]|nr:FAD/NAD(P)-binding oxidoreductase [Blastocatellia bacterium]